MDWTPEHITHKCNAALNLYRMFIRYVHDKTEVDLMLHEQLTSAF